jgi:hypothetical protein
MQSLQPTPALPEFPQLSRLPCFSARNQGLVADYLAHLRARHYTPAMQEATIRALKSFAILRPEVRQATLYHDLTQTTPTDIDAWSEASLLTGSSRPCISCRAKGAKIGTSLCRPMPLRGSNGVWSSIRVNRPTAMSFGIANARRGRSP